MPPASTATAFKEDPQRWRLVREVPLAVVVGLGLQAIALVWWTSFWTTDLANKVSFNEKTNLMSITEIHAQISRNTNAIEDIRRDRDAIVELKARMNGIESLMREVRDELRKQH